MSTPVTNATAQFTLDGVMSRLSGMGHAAGELMMQATESRAREEEIARLKEMTDAELKELGIHNEADLLRYAFHDLMAF